MEEEVAVDLEHVGMMFPFQRPWRRWCRRELYINVGMNALDRCAWVAVLQLRHWAYREGRPRGDLLSLDRAIRVFIQLSRDTAVADVVQVMSSSNKAAVTAVTKQQ